LGIPGKQRCRDAEALAENGRIRVQSAFPGWSVSSEPLWGDPAKMLLKTIDVWKPDLVVVGSHGRSVPRDCFSEVCRPNWFITHPAPFAWFAVQ
jgi:hypothetical protein